MNPSEDALNRNIQISYLIRFAQGTWLPMSTIILFYRSNGLTLSQIFILKAILSVVALLLEVPTGYFADIYGRKRSIVIGLCCVIMSPLIYTFTSDYLWFIVAECFLGTGIAFISGADSALVYDSLLSEHREKRYPKVESQMYFTLAFAEGTGAIVGGILAAKNLHYPFLAQVLLFLAVFPFIYFVVEPPRHKPIISEERKRQSIFTILQMSVKEVPVLKYIALFFAWSATGTFLMVWFSQPYLELIQLPPLYFGYAWAAYHFSLALVAMHSYRVRHYLTTPQIMFATTLILSTAYCFLGLVTSWIGILAIVAIYMMRGVRDPMTKIWINELVDPRWRATVLSSVSFIFRLTFIIVGPLLGWIADHAGLQTTFIIISVVWLVPSLVIIDGASRKLNKAL